MLEVLKILGVVDEVLAEGVSGIVVQAYKLPGGTEKLPLHRIFPHQEPTPSIPYVSTVYRLCEGHHLMLMQPNAVALGQDLLEGILGKAIFDRFGVKIEHGKELTSVKSTEDKVTAQLTVTSPDGKDSMEVAEAKYIVGTDGGRSRVRKELGFAFEGEALPGDSIIGDVQMGGLEPLVSDLGPSVYIRLNIILSLRMLGQEPKDGKVNACLPRD
jgi:2-polyprenyl-6-methoxyphenol hydroxylase-like FAD-dependent oxidoreductase